MGRAVKRVVEAEKGIEREQRNREIEASREQVEKRKGIGKGRKREEPKRAREEQESKRIREGGGGKQPLL
jgi:hypothetical protein